jgi:gag-polypeptide of LTR copia-type
MDIPGVFRTECTADIQLGSAREAWKRLNNKFEPKTATSCLRLQNLFHKSYLQSSQDPDKWITELEELRMRIIAAKSELTEESLMEHVLNNVPEMYNIEVSKLEDRLGDLSDLLRIEEIGAALSLKYEHIYSKKNKNKRFHQNEETALFAAGFKGKCNNCGR